MNAALHLIITYFTANPSHWSTGAYARDADGVKINPLNSLAVCWCAVGYLSTQAQGGVWSVMIRIGDYFGLTATEISAIIEANDTAQTVQEALENLKGLIK